MFPCAAHWEHNCREPECAYKPAPLPEGMTRADFERVLVVPALPPNVFADAVAQKLRNLNESNALMEELHDLPEGTLGRFKGGL